MRHFSWKMGLGVSLFAALALACGDADEETGDDDGLSSSGAPSQSSSSSGGPTDNGGSSGAPTTEAGDLELIIGGESLPITLAGLATTTYKDATAVALTTIWEASGTSESYQSYTFKFVGADGFRPETRANCAEVVFDAEAFAQGYITTDSQRLVWEDELGYAPCASVQDLATIEAVRQ